MIAEHESALGIRPLCNALGEPRSSYYRSRRQKDELVREKRVSPRALSQEEQRHVLEVVNSERFRDVAPPEVHATLLDEGVYLCSERTIYRILHREGQTTERRERPSLTTT